MSHPALVDFEAGTHTLCVCGQSQNGFFCDGSHKGRGVTPFILKLENARTLHLCNCGQTGNKPFCDGSHVNLKEA
jgi:CDGSH-type Zn-finger protein